MARCESTLTLLAAAGLAMWVALAGGCKEDEIRAYRAPRDATKEPPAQETSAQGSVTWTVPASWQSVQSDQPMRLATFRPVGGLPEVAVTAFPGDSGGMLANINRWRGQIGLAPVDEAQLPGLVHAEKVEGVSVSTVDM